MKKDINSHSKEIKDYEIFNKLFLTNCFKESLIGLIFGRKKQNFARKNA